MGLLNYLSDSAKTERTRDRFIQYLTAQTTAGNLAWSPTSEEDFTKNGTRARLRPDYLVSFSLNGIEYEIFLSETEDRTVFLHVTDVGTNRVVEMRYDGPARELYTVVSEKEPAVVRETRIRQLRQTEEERSERRKGKRFSRDIANLLG